MKDHSKQAIRVLVLAGDGVGPEVIDSALNVLESVVADTSIRLDIEHQPVGMEAYRRHGRFISEHTLEAACRADAVLFGAEGGPEWDAIRNSSGLKGALLELRERLGLFANIRPVRSWRLPVPSSPLRAKVAAKADLVIVRELSGGVYTGQPRGRKTVEGQIVAFDTQSYSEAQVSKISQLAMNLAKSRSGRLVSIDKSNVMESGRLWREVVSQTASNQFKDIQVEHLYADYFLYALIQTPTRFDVVLADNLFGDLASDCAGVIAGSLGLLPSASIGVNGKSVLLEPVHGAAPDIAGTGSANPVGAILCVPMFLERVCNRPDLGAIVTQAVGMALEDGICTPDIGGSATTRELTKGVVDRVKRLRSEARNATGLE